MKAQEILFKDFKNLIAEKEHKEGIVLLGAGGEINEWIEGVAEILNIENISETSNPDELFTEAYLMTTSGGRIDLALVVDFDKVDSGKMAIWRINFGNCSWISDYLVNYACQH